MPLYHVCFKSLAPPPPHQFIVDASSPEAAIQLAERVAREVEPPLQLGEALGVSEISLD